MLYNEVRLPYTFLSVTSGTRRVLYHGLKNTRHLLRLIKNTTIHFAFYRRTIQRVISNLIVLVIRFRVNNVILRTMIMNFVRTCNIVKLMMSLQITPLLNGPIVNVSNLRTRKAFIIPFVRTINIRYVNFIRRRPLLIRKDTSTQLCRGAIRKGLLKYIIYRCVLLATGINAIIITLMTMSTLLTFARLRNVNNIFPGGHSFIPLHLYHSNHFLYSVTPTYARNAISGPLITYL